MNQKRNYSGLLAVMFTALPLAALSVVSVYEPIKSHLEKLGWSFSTPQQWSPLPKKKQVLVNEVAPKPKNHYSIDSLKSQQLSRQQIAKIDSLKGKVQFLTAHRESTSLLEHFFKSLLTTENQVSRIWYYGDSQAEGDRITFDFRQLLQKRFGGSGMGFLPLEDVATYRNVEPNAGGAWMKYNIFNHLGKQKSYGYGGTKFILGKIDSQNYGGLNLKIGKGLSYKKLYLAFGKNSAEGKVIMKHSSFEKPKEYSLIGEKAFNLIELSGDYLGGTIQLQVSSNGPIFGYLLEDRHGVQVDNLAIRGHSGDRLNYISNDMLQSANQALDVDLIVFHYGNNVIPYLKDEKHIQYVIKNYIQLFNRYKNLFPNASILVIGSGDMGRKIDGVSTPYEVITSFNSALEKAAIENGCAFFDFYSFMRSGGGILKWQELGIAGLDGHLTPGGQSRMAQALFNELMREFEVFKIENHL